ncbi:phasin family protein [Stappia sp. MMSF_3263]|uniref:phasin family protein n=1 Tax=Stappia sp. MMSF_3263 TaxID=3046693 RepID=UPI00273E3D92|nr:phasin family protein [Stappia sp. MMSF_3263]
MAKARNKTPADAVNASLVPFETAYANPLLIAQRMHSEALRATLGWQAEMLDFFRHRIEQDIRLVDSLIKAREPDEVVSTCSAFCSQAFDDYTREAVKAARYGQDVASETSEQVRKDAEELSNDLKTATLTVA